MEAREEIVRMGPKKLTLLLIIGIAIFSNVAIAETQETGTKVETELIEKGRSYHGASFSELFANPEEWDGEYIAIYGYYDKSSNLLKESEIADTGLIITISPTCEVFVGGTTCDFNDGWMQINGLFTFDGGYNLEAEHVFMGKEAGKKCQLNNECQSSLCLLCPGMKMLLPGYLTYEDLPENAVKIDISVTEFGIIPEVHRGSVVVINPAPDYGYCAGGVLPPSGPPTEEFKQKVHEEYVSAGILELDEPFVWGPGTSKGGGSGYCIGIWNNNKYMLFHPLEEKYLDLIKEALTSQVSIKGLEDTVVRYGERKGADDVINQTPVSEDYFNRHMKLLSSKTEEYIYDEEDYRGYQGRKTIQAQFVYSADEYSFNIRYEFETHLLVNDSWIELSDDEIKTAVIAQQQLREIEDPLSKEEAFNKLKRECLSGLKETRINLWADGRIEMQGLETISMQENRCKAGRINLETGEITECRETVCYVTAAEPGAMIYKPKGSDLTYILVGIGVLFLVIILFLKRR
jgi:hypothetical protein